MTDTDKREWKTMSEQPNYERDELELLRQHLFGRSDDTDSDDSDDTVHRGNYSPREGANPPVRVDDRMRALDYTRRLLDPRGYGALEPELPPDEGASQ